MADLQQLAARAASYFEVHTRPPARQGDEGKRIWVLKEKRPTWVWELVHKAHGSMGPDDWKYDTVHDALESLAEGQDPEEPNLEADIYNHDLLEWLASHLERAGYVDEAVEQFGHAGEGGARGGGIMGDIAQGQWYEKDEVWNIVVGELQKRLEAEEEGEPEVFEHGSPKDWHPRGRKRTRGERP